MNRNLIGWILAGVFGAALVGYIALDTVSGDDARVAAIGSGAQGIGPPPEVAMDVEAIREAKPEGNRRIGGPPAGEQVPSLSSNPEPVCDLRLPPNVFAVWRNQPQNLNQAAAIAQDIVVGTVTGSEAGAPLTAEAPGEPGGMVETPVQRVSIRVDETVKGRAREGSVVTIERLGDARGCYRVHGDPPYRTGAEVLLLLEPGQGGRPAHVISPAGRYEVGADKALQAMDDNPFGSEVAGQRLAQVVEQLRRGR